MSVFREYTKEPADPIGLDQVSIWQRLFKKWAKQFFIRTVSGGRLVPDPNGGVHLIIDKPLIPSPTQAGVAGNWNYRGLYSAAPPTPYMTFDVVQFGAGTAAGMYLSTIDNNLNSPDTGIGWTQVSSSSGTWL